MYRGTYTLTGHEVSMFSRKLEAQLRYQSIPYRWAFKTLERGPELEARAGTRFVPLLETPDGWLIHDTIALGPMLDARFHETPVIPRTPAQRGACFVLEDLFDHWLPRHALHTRWCYPADVERAGASLGANMVLGQSADAARTAEEDAQIAGFGQTILSSFGAFACGAFGAGEDQAYALRADLERLMELLGAHLERHPFLLGDRACLADFIVVGVAVAHFLHDPEPRAWIGASLPMLERYVERVWRGGGDGDWLPGDAIAETVWPIFDHAVQSYHRFAGASIAAAARGEKTFALDLGDGVFTARAMRRLEKARLHVGDEVLRCGAEKTRLASSGVLEYYLQPPKLTGADTIS